MANELLKSRMRKIKGAEKDGKCVLYIMSRDQRVQDNHALIAAQKHALAKDMPLAVVFCLLESTGYRSREHYQFMMDGLHQVEKDLQEKHIPFMLVIGDPKERIKNVVHHTKPDAVYFDFNPLRGPRSLAKHIAQITKHAAVYIVDTHNIIPVWVTSDKQETAAYTIRGKIHKNIERYLAEPDTVQKHPHNWPGKVASIRSLKKDISRLLENIDASGVEIAFESGEAAGLQQLKDFVAHRLENYAVLRNDPAEDNVSDLSPYLHFGQLSSLRVALYLREELFSKNDELHIIESSKMPKPGDAPTKKDGVNILIEEMVVRKELSDNYCYYQQHYDSLKGAPEWARETLAKHESDPREHVYKYDKLKLAETHDEAWNAAQRQMTKTGKMHGYMRMYWAKKVLEWTEHPKQAIEYLIKLNDHYSIDGGDPNGYVGIMWSVCGVHDRPWTERDIFGKVRYMNYAGLKRKFDIEAYEHQWS